MRTARSLKLLPFVLLAATTTPGCRISEVEEPDNPAVTVSELTYSFGDASVPPEYHRSYTITVTADTAAVVIDSYGEVLADEEYPITAEQFADLNTSLNNNNIRNCTLDDNAGCTGGTTEGVSYTDSTGAVFSGSVYHCGGIDDGDLCGDISSFADDVRSAVPDFDALLQSTETE